MSGVQRVESSCRTPPLGANNLGVATSLFEQADKDVEGKLTARRSRVGDNQGKETRALQAQLEVWVRLYLANTLSSGGEVYKFGLQG